MAAAGLGQGAPGTSPVPENAALEAVKLCVKLGADINAVNADGETALHGAAYRGPQGSSTIVQFLVDNGANVNVKNRRGWSPLVIAEGLFFEASNTINCFYRQAAAGRSVRNPALRTSSEMRPL